MSEAIERNCPASIRDCHQWVAWKYVERGGKQTKAPVNPHNGLLASSTDPSTWGPFSQAMQACERDASLAGIGFVFSADDPYCGVDLDDSIDEATRELKPWAQQIVDRLDSYTEISPSGLGLKVFIKASKPGSRCRKAYHDGEVEIYDRDRFFTVTGNHIASGSSIIDYTDEGPRVVGLLTWAGGGEGLGQSTPFLLSAMRGKLPATLEGLPAGAREVGCQIDESQEIVQVPSTIYGEPMQVPLGFLAKSDTQDDLIDSIVDRPRLRPAPREPEDSGIITDRLRIGPQWTPESLIATSAGSSIALMLGLQYGIPLVLQALRNARKQRGNTVLDDEQFKKLMDQYQNLLKLLEQKNQPPGNQPPTIKT